MSDFTHNTERKAKELFGPDAELSVTEFPSGSVNLLIRWSGHFAVLEELNGEWGVSVDIPSGEEFTGHRAVFDSLDQALRLAKDSTALPEVAEDANSGEGWLTNQLNSEPTDS